MKVWTRFPFIRILLPFIGGILLYSVFQLDSVFLPFWVLAPLPFIGVFLFFRGRLASYHFRWIIGAVINVQLLFTGYYLSFLENEKSHHNHFSEIQVDSQPVYTAVLLEAPQKRANSARLFLSVTRVFLDNKVYHVKGKLLAYVAKDSLVDSLTYGTEIMFSQLPDLVRKPANPGEFNYASYLSVKRVYHQVYLARGSYIITGKGKGNIFKAFALNMRARLLSTMQQYGIQGREYAVAAALLIGYDDMLDANQRREYAGAGVVHILCVSGLHVGVVFLIADYLFYFLRKRKKMVWLRPSLIILVIWTYALITGFAPSVLRASLMFSLITVGKSLNRHAHTYNTLAASAFILLVITPGMIYDLGFQLSYAAVGGIVTFQPHIQKIFAPVHVVSKYFWGLISVSVAAQLVTAPLSVYYFHQFPNYFLLANLIAIPLAGVLIYTGVLFIFFSFIPVLGKIVATLLILQIKILNNTVSFVEGLPGAVSKALYLSPISVIVVYFVVIALFLWYLQKNRRWFMAAIFFCVILAADYAFIAIGRANQQLLMVHSVNRHSAISMVSGDSQWVMCDSGLIVNPQLLNYPTESFRVKAGIRHFNLIDFSATNPHNHMLGKSLVFDHGFFQFGNKRGIVLSPLVNLPEIEKTIRLDYVILTSNYKASLRMLQAYFPGATFIADASNAQWKSKKWAEEASKLRLTYYSVRESGAWVQNLNE